MILQSNYVDIQKPLVTYFSRSRPDRNNWFSELKDHAKNNQNRITKSEKGKKIVFC